jgi:uncharacterized Zn-finger protein
MDNVDSSSMKVEASDSADRVDQMCTEQPYPVLLIKVKTECKEELDSWTVETDQSTQSEHGGTQNTDSLTTKQEYYDGDVDVKQEMEVKDISVAPSQAHVDSPREHIGVKLYRCDVCQKTFSRKDALKVHYRIHTGEKPYKCDECEKTFSEKTQLARHAMVHTGDKPYKCDVCENNFCDKWTLVRHLRLHTGEKPYKCDVCNATFTLKQSLVRHSKLHSGVKPYKCDVCEKAFNQKSTLVRHTKVHSREKRY